MVHWWASLDRVICPSYFMRGQLPTIVVSYGSFLLSWTISPKLVLLFLFGIYIRLDDSILGPEMRKVAG